MSYSITYKTLFELKILHRFFLDKGEKKFETLDARKKGELLQGFELDAIMDVLPTPQTASLLKGHKLIFKKRQHGILVAVKTDKTDASFPFIRLDTRLALTFFMRVKDPLFYNYTELPLDLLGKQLLLTNERELKKDGSFFLIDEQVLVPKQAGAPESLLGMIKVRLHPGDDEGDILDDSGKLFTPHPVFIALFENRRTYWRYVFPSDQAGDSDALIQEGGDAARWITKNKHPLTRTGFISLKLNGTELPNPGISLIKPDKATQHIYSETYM